MRSRLVLALASGLALWLAFPSHNLWWLAPVGVALLALATRGARAREGLLLGLVSGLACFVPLLSWSGIYVGKLPWLALSTLEALYVAVMALLVAVLQGGPSLAGERRVRPLVVALLWVAQEAARGRTPFGGFPWARLAFSQADSPLVHLASLGGAPFVTFATALTGGVLAAGLARAGRGYGWVAGARRLRPALRRVLAVWPGVLGAAVLMALPLLVPLPTAGPTAQFMAVQGNVPQAGLDFNAQRRAVLDNHVKATQAAAAKVRAGLLPQPDLVVWPENSSDIDPLRNPDAALEINQTVSQVGAPLVVGAVLDQPSPDVSNASLLYRPGQGVTQRYIKQHPVPFAEYIPYRSFFRHLSNKVDLVRADFVAGHGAGVFRVPSRTGGTIAAGITICFEVAIDDLVRDTVNHGANVLVVQTNNATFGYSDESAQQLAISRLRAIEFGRSVVHISTVGVSALVTPDGTAHQQTSLFTSAVLSGRLPLRTAQTVADRVGAWPEGLACAAVLLLLLARGLAVRRRR